MLLGVWSNLCWNNKIIMSCSHYIIFKMKTISGPFFDDKLNCTKEHHPIQYLIWRNQNLSLKHTFMYLGKRFKYLNQIVTQTPHNFWTKYGILTIVHRGHRHIPVRLHFIWRKWPFHHALTCYSCLDRSILFFISCKNNQSIFTYSRGESSVWRISRMLLNLG